MPVFVVTSPDGKKFKVTGPEGSTAEQALQQVQAQMQRNPPAPKSAPVPEKPYSPVDGMSGLQRFAAGAGQAVANFGRGMRQRAVEAGAAMDPRIADQAIAEERAKIADARLIDSPLLATRGGKLGSFAGNAAITIPTLAIPGANTVVGAGLIGAATGFAQPTVKHGETLLNTGAGGAMGAASQYVGGQIAKGAERKLVERSAAKEAERLANSVRDDVLKEARAVGYKVPPTAINPNATNTVLESVSGKAATRQVMQAENALVTDKLIAQDLGMKVGAPITRGALSAVRAKAGKAYEAIKSVGTIQSDDAFVSAVKAITNVDEDLAAAYPGIGAQVSGQVSELAKAISKPEHSASQIVGLSKFLRSEARKNYTAAFRSGNPEQLALAKAQTAAVDAVEELVDRHLERTGNTALGQAWKAARVTIAKAHTAEAAMKRGHINAVRLAQQMGKGKPMSGGFGIAARFAEQFEDVAVVPKSGAGVSKLAATIGTAGTGAGLATGNIPLAATAAASATVPYAIRKGIVSSVGQNVLATPNYAPGITKNALLQLSGKAGKYAVPPALALTPYAGQ